MGGRASRFSLTVSYSYASQAGRPLQGKLYLAPSSYCYLNLHSAIGEVQYDSLSLQSSAAVRAQRYMHTAVATTQDGEYGLRMGVAGGLSWRETRQGPINRKYVALAFDVDGAGVKNGNTVKAAVAILDALKATSAKCTFFVTGKFAEAYPDVVIRMAAEGHELANHSYDHPYFDTLTPDQVKDEIARTDQLIEKLTGRTTRPYFRFPYGCRNGALVRQVQDLGYMSVSWSLDPGDWQGKSGGAIHAAILSRVRAGDIVLLHTDYPVQMSEAIPAVVNSLRARGLQPTTITQLLRRN